MDGYTLFFWIALAIPYIAVTLYFLSKLPDLLDDLLYKRTTIKEFLYDPFSPISFAPIVDFYLILVLGNLVSFVTALCFHGSQIHPFLATFGIVNFAILFVSLPLYSLFDFIVTKVIETSKVINKHFPEVKAANAKPKKEPIELTEIAIVSPDYRIFTYNIGDHISYRKEWDKVGLNNRYEGNITHIFYEEHSGVHFFIVSKPPSDETVEQIQITGSMPYKIHEYKEKEKWDSYLRHP